MYFTSTSVVVTGWPPNVVNRAWPAPSLFRITPTAVRWAESAAATELEMPPDPVYAPPAAPCFTWLVSVARLPLWTIREALVTSSPVVQALAVPASVSDPTASAPAPTTAARPPDTFRPPIDPLAMTRNDPAPPASVIVPPVPVAVPRLTLAPAGMANVGLPVSVVLANVSEPPAAAETVSVWLPMVSGPMTAIGDPSTAIVELAVTDTALPPYTCEALSSVPPNPLTAKTPRPLPVPPLANETAVRNLDVSAAGTVTSYSNSLGKFGFDVSIAPLARFRRLLIVRAPVVLVYQSATVWLTA